MLKVRSLTFGTAAWKFRPVTGFAPVAWKFARILTNPGRVGDVCGVRVMRSSFLSYAVYPDGAAACAGGGDVVCGTVAAAVNSDCIAGAAAGAGAGEGAAAGATGESKRPRMSCAMLRGAAGGAGESVFVGGDVAELPKISARRSCVAGTAGAPFVAGVLEMSSPRRST